MPIEYIEDYVLVYQTQEGHWDFVEFTATNVTVDSEARVLAVHLSTRVQIVLYTYTTQAELERYTLACIAEEASEVAKEACKNLRFQHAESRTIREELEDLQTMYEMFNCVSESFEIEHPTKQSKWDKTLKYFTEELETPKIELLL